MTTTIKELQERVDFLYRNLRRSGFATDGILDAVKTRFDDSRSENGETDTLWEEWAELRAIAISGATRHKGSLTDDSLDAALLALKEVASTIEIPSLDTIFPICPASWARIIIIEEAEWWLRRLEASKAILSSEAQEGVPNRFVMEKRCNACGGLTEPGSLKKLMDEITIEIKYQRGMIYANVTAPTAAPVEEPVDWVDEIAILEETAMMQEYHRINYDLIQQLPDPVSADQERELPRSWAFLFQSLEERTHKPAVHFMKNRPLAAIIATIVLETIKSQAAKKNAKDKPKSTS